MNRQTLGQRVNKRKNELMNETISYYNDTKIEDLSRRPTV